MIEIDPDSDRKEIKNNLNVYPNKIPLWGLGGQTKKTNVRLSAVETYL